MAASVMQLISCHPRGGSCVKGSCPSCPLLQQNPSSGSRNAPFYLRPCCQHNHSWWQWGSISGSEMSASASSRAVPLARYFHVCGRRCSAAPCEECVLCVCKRLCSFAAKSAVWVGGLTASGTFTWQEKHVLVRFCDSMAWALFCVLSALRQMAAKC